MLDAVVVGAGPNGLTAAIAMASAGLSVRVLEGADRPGGGMRTQELTLPGFRHDICSAVHPMGVLSPYWRSLPLEEHGLQWLHPRFSVAHPLDGGRAVVLAESLDETAERLGQDGEAWRRMVAPFTRDAPRLFADLMAPLGIPRKPITMARFGLSGVLPASLFASLRFCTPEAKALFGGLAGHSILPLDAPLSAAIGLIFAVSGHLTSWPVPRGGAESITDALTSLLGSLGGELETGSWVRSLGDVPECRAIVFDTSPDALAKIAGDALPRTYRKRIGNYRYGPGVFKLDWALDGPIPWEAPECHQASTIHVGGTLPEIAASEKAVWQGRHPRHPYLIVCQQSHLDPSRAPAGKHTGYAYCHVPHASSEDMSDAITGAIERFAPGFRDQILATHAWTCADLEAHNPNYIGGAITGGVADWRQLFSRPIARWSPYTTPNPKLFLCSASTPPGGGVHGMCGFYAARAVLRRLRKPGPKLLPS